MGLFSSLKTRFFPPELCRVAKTSDVSAITECIGRTSVVVIGRDLGDSAPFDSQQDVIMAIAEAAAQKKSFDGDIHKYEIDGATFLPVFTDTAFAESFCGAYASLLGRFHAFRLFRVPGTYISSWICNNDIIVVNPQSDNEVEIDRSKSSAICTGLALTDNFSGAHFVSLVLPMPGISRPIEFCPET
jgi:hypothetical protein